MYQRPKSSDCFVISVGRSGISVSAIQQQHVSHVLPPFYVVAIGKIRTKVPAAALLAAKRCARDHQPDGDDAACAPELVVAGRRRGDADSCAPRVELRDRLLRTGAAPEQPTTAPHQIAYRIDGRDVAVRLTATVVPSDNLRSLRFRATQRRPHRVGCTRPEDESFEQRIAGESIRSMDAGAGDFAGRKQSADRCASVEIRLNAAHEVVRCGTDWNPIARQIQANACTRFGDRREARAYERGVEMRK